MIPTTSALNKKTKRSLGEKVGAGASATNRPDTVKLAIKAHAQYMESVKKISAMRAVERVCRSPASRDRSVSSRSGFSVMMISDNFFARQFVKPHNFPGMRAGADYLGNDTIVRLDRLV